MPGLRAEVASLFAEWLGLDVERYTSLTTVEDDTTFVSKDGGLMSLLLAHGHRRVVGAAELAHLTGQLVTLWGSALSGHYHTLDICFHSDPATTGREIDWMLAPSLQTAARQGLDLGAIFAERRRHLPRYAATETVYLALWTAPTGLPRTVRRQERRARRQRLRDRHRPGGFTRDNQNIEAVNRYLIDTHRSCVATVLAEMTAFGFDLELLPVERACRELRGRIDPDWTPDDWQPLLPGGFPRACEHPDGTYDPSTCWLPALGSQLIPRDLRIVDYRTVQIGDRLYQPLYVDLPQLTEVQRFERLFERVRGERLPWRLLIRLTGGAEAWLLAKRSISSLLYFAGHQNKLINQSVGAMRKFINGGGLGVRAQMALTSWVDTTQPAGRGRTHAEALRARTAQLASYLQAWGACIVREYGGHPVKAWASTVPGLSTLHIGTRYVAPLAEVLATLPLFRAASPWRRGALLYRTRDGKLYPYQPGSSEQGTWNELYFARPGSGKSATMNANNLGLVLSSGFRRLPFIRIIDIGPSSEGLIDLLREGLPPARRHEAQFHALVNDAGWAVNPLDTQLGWRRPLPQERAFLVSFLSVLATKPGDREPAEGIADLIGLVLDLAYVHFADDQSPKRYVPDQDAGVDGALVRHAVALDAEPTWWEVVDALFEAGDPEAAVRAQRCAVPVLSDLVAVAQQPQVRDLYGGAMRLVGTAESPIQLFNRIVSAATREFPLLAHPTRFDLGNARVAALDVAALCGDMTPVGQRQTAVAYLLARHILGRDLFLDDHLARAAPPRYRAYHARRFEEHLAYPKKFCVDEKHRCGPIAAINAQLVRDQREGRKNNVQVALASQILTDFSAEMIELASSVYIMEYGNDDTAEDVREKFSLPASAIELLRVYGNGPTPDGAPFLCAMKTKRGLVCQLLYLTNGPIEMWALSTTAEDRVIRRRLYQRFGAPAALRALARRYPSGSAKADLERRLEHSAHPALDRDQVLDAIVGELAGAIAAAETAAAGPLPDAEEGE